MHGVGVAIVGVQLGQEPVDPAHPGKVPAGGGKGLANALAEKLARAAETGVYPALVTSTLRRRFLRTVLGAKGLTAPVLSYEEIGMEARPAMIGVVPA